ncbi:subtilase family protein, partial [Striga asiatica]
IAVYKALYRLFGGFVADVVAAIDQAVHDGVDILNLSVGPNSPPSNTKITYLNSFDITLLSAMKVGVFVAQVAGNGGPSPKTMVYYSPWITTVAAAVDDRQYKKHLTLGNGKILAGLGLSRKFHPELHPGGCVVQDTDDWVADIRRAEDEQARGMHLFLLERFLESDDKNGRVRLEKTVLKGDDELKQVAVGTGVYEDVSCGQLLKSIGYKSIPINGLPFDNYKGIVPNHGGRVLVDASQDHMQYEAGLYMCGWLKRGPTGIIATNLYCAEE